MPHGNETMCDWWFRQKPSATNLVAVVENAFDSHFWTGHPFLHETSPSLLHFTFFHVLGIYDKCHHRQHNYSQHNKIKNIK